MPEKRVTISDIAKTAGVSISTVSRVINNDPHINPVIREKVQELITEFGYQKRSFKKRIIGVIIADIANPFFALLIKGIENAAKIQGYNIILCDSENNITIENEHLLNLMEIGALGIIFVPTKGENPQIRKILKENVPLVFLDRIFQLDNINYVISDNQDGAYQAVRYLLDLGHKRIVYLGGFQDLSTDQDRYKGYQRALKEKSIEYQNDLRIIGNYNFERAYTKVRDLIQKKISFTAIFCSDDVMAFGAKKALEENGYSIPNDVSLIGYDDIPFSSLIGLNTVSQPINEMGRNSLLLLVDIITKRVSTPKRVILRPSIVIRDSCKKFE